MNNQLNNGVMVSVYFKEVHTTNTKQYDICPSWSKNQLMTYLRPKIFQDFGILNFKLIETGQNVNVAEYAPEIVMDNYSLEDTWGSNMNVSFYISPIYSSLEVGLRIENGNIIVMFDNYNQRYHINAINNQT